MVSRYISEFLGTAFLLMIVVGSGIMGESLSNGNGAIVLLANSIATGAGLFVLIQVLAPISGAHFNPVVSFVEWLTGRLKKNDFIIYCIAQFSGAILGVLITHVMFNLSLIQTSHHERVGFNLIISEFVATFGLICIILILGKKKSDKIPGAVSAYITAAYWFTSSTSFANPAVTVARSLTDTFCGIAPSGILIFIMAQIIGAGVAFLVLKRAD